jgi:hypothetical protein
MIEKITGTQFFRMAIFDKDENGYTTVQDLIAFDDIDSLVKYVNKYHDIGVQLSEAYADFKFDPRVKKIGTKLKKIAATL